MKFVKQWKRSLQVTESKDSREWTLHVKSPLAKDSGIYECQVNTEPKMSMAFQLNIIGKYIPHPHTHAYMHAQYLSVRDKWNKWNMQWNLSFMIYVYTFITAGHVEDRRHSQSEPVELLIKNCNSVYLCQQRTIMFHSFICLFLCRHQIFIFSFFVS